MKAVAPWVRTRLRTAPGPAVALLLLVLVTSFLAAAFPGAVDAYESRGLRHEVSATAPDGSVIQLSSDPGQDVDGGPEGNADALRAGRLTENYRRILAALPDSLRVDTGQSAYGARTLKPVQATDKWLPELNGGWPVFTLSAQTAVAEHSTPASGRLPRAAAGSVTPATGTVEAAVTSATARALRIEAGSTIHVPRADGTPSPYGSPASSNHCGRSRATGPSNPCCARRRTSTRRISPLCRTGTAHCCWPPKRHPSCCPCPWTPRPTGASLPTPTGWTSSVCPGSGGDRLPRTRPAAERAAHRGGAAAGDQHRP